MEAMAHLEIVDLPNWKDGDFPVRHVSLPEANSSKKMIPQNGHL